MMRKIYLSLLTTALLGSAHAQTLVGITTDDKIFTMANVASPGVISTPVSITGITSGQAIVGADYRPLTGELYVLGYNAVNGNTQLYRVNTTTAVATAVNTSPIVLTLGTGMNVGFDFNPVVDRIRVTGSNMMNYRLNPETGAIAATDANLNFATGDPNFGTSPAIGAVAYTNSYVGASTTSLYNYDYLLNVLTRQDPPNAGTLNTIGASGVVVNAVASTIDMDVYMDPVTLNNTAYLAANVGVGIDDNLYTMDLNTGMVTSLGTIGSGLNVKNIAISINRILPPVTGKMVFGLQKGTNTLISFDSDNPRMLRGYVAITGVTAGQTIVGLDFRPATMELYALGYNQASGQYQLYTINTTTGAAMAVGTSGTLNLGMDTHVGFDFNPVADRIRVVSSANGMSYRLNPMDGSISATDTALVYAAGDVSFGKATRIGSIAYTNSYKGATSTTMFGIDDTLGAFVKIDPPNSGMTSTLGQNIFVSAIADMSTDIDFFYDSTASANIGFMTANTASAVYDKFYTISSTNGMLTLVSDIGLGVPVSDIAVQPQFKNAVGISTVTKAKRVFEVYPNPATGEIYLIAEGTDNKTQVVITDIAGRELKRMAYNSQRINIADLQAGIYFITLQADGEVFESQKIIKQ